MNTLTPQSLVRRLDRLEAWSASSQRQKADLPTKWLRANYPLISFVEEAWPHIEPHDFVGGWHIEAICRHLEAVTETAAGNENSPYPTIRNLLINIPPRTSKSLIASVFWPSWVWITWPEAQFLYSSYSADLSMRDAVKCRTLMQSAWYQSRWGDQWCFTSDQNIKSYYANDKQGYRISTSVTGKATGFGGDFLVGDDLHETSEDLAVSRASIISAREHWLTVIPSRVTDPKRTCKVLIGQRVGVDDVSDAVLSLDLDPEYAYMHLNIPMEFETEFSVETPLWHDPRAEEGELISPERFSPGYVAEQKASLRHRYFAQYQQRPTAEGASLFPRTWWRRYHTMPDIDWFDIIIQSWDFRFGEDKQEGSFVAGHLWARKGPPETGQVYLLDRVFERASFVESVKMMMEFSAKWPGAYAKLIENKANGPAIFNFLRSKIFGLILVAVDGRHGSKRARAEAVATIAEEGRAWLPDEELCPWVNDYAGYMERFPATPDDDTDATSQAWHYLCPPKPATDTVREERRKRQEIITLATRHRNGNGKVVKYSRTGV